MPAATPDQRVTWICSLSCLKSPTNVEPQLRFVACWLIFLCVKTSSSRPRKRSRVGEILSAQCYDRLCEKVRYYMSETERLAEVRRWLKYAKIWTQPRSSLNNGTSFL